jgi:F-type H+-transporting ATPase subunit a
MAIVLKPMLWVIEVLALLIKHAVLAIRLLANMFAGHIVLLGIMGLAFSWHGAVSGTWWVAAPIAVISSALFSVLELFVAFLQAYVFTFLSALFIGAAVHHH